MRNSMGLVKEADQYSKAAIDHYIDLLEGYLLHGTYHIGHADLKVWLEQLKKNREM